MNDSKQRFDYLWTHDEFHDRPPFSFPSAVLQLAFAYCRCANNSSVLLCIAGSFSGRAKRSGRTGGRNEARCQSRRTPTKALNYLDPVTDDTLPETVERLGRIRKTLETQIVEAVTQPVLITLTGNFSVKEAAEKLAEQSGNKIVWPDELDALMAERKIDLEIEKAPFWQAMNQLEDKADLRVNTFGGAAGELLLVTANKNAAVVPMDSQGIFQASVLQVSARRNLRLAPISLSIPASGVTVIDEFDEKVLLPNPKATFSAAVQPEIPEVEFSIPIGLVDRQIEKINQLEATLNAVLPGRSESFEFRKIGRLKPGHCSECWSNTVLMKQETHLSLT